MRDSKRAVPSIARGGAALGRADQQQLWLGVARPKPARNVAARVALTAGEDHAGIVFEGLRLLKEEIAWAIGEKPVINKPNFVAIDQQLAATPAQSVEGFLEFLGSIGKHRKVVIA
jgi:hypothetical protein